MPGNKDFAEINKKLDAILKELNNNKEKEQKELKILITKLVEKYGEATKDTRRFMGFDFNIILFTLLQIIYTKTYPHLKFELDEVTVRRIEDYKHDFEGLKKKPSTR